MNDIALKYRLLDKQSKTEINDFLDFLLSKSKLKNSYDISNYKKRILTVSDWTDDDILIFQNNNKQFNNWKVEEW